MEPIFVTESTFEKTVSPGAPNLTVDCDLVTHVRNPGESPVSVRVDVGLHTKVAYLLEPGVSRPLIDGGPLPMPAVRYRGVRIVTNGDVVLTCALCDRESMSTATDCRIGRWVYKDDDMTLSGDAA